jgi:hypothetical protein
MPSFTANLLLESGVTGVVNTPAANHLFVVNLEASALSQSERETFHSLTAKCLYLAKRTRPDILLPVSFLATRVKAPDVDDKAKLDRVFKYINGTTNFGIG